MFNKDDSAVSFNAVIKKQSWIIPPIFKRIIDGCIDKNDNQAETEKINMQMLNTFNMGIGFVIVLDKNDSKQAQEYLDSRGYPAWEIGKITAGGSGRAQVCFE
jgi:phosphoribosylformylglycinamidine cyclo-ligase